MATGVTVRNINIDVKVDAKSAIAQLERLEKALDGLKKATLDIGDTKKKVGDIKKSISDISKSASAAVKNISELKKMATGTGKASGELSKKTKQARTSLDGLRKTIGKLLLYRTIRQTLMMIGNSFREGLKYVKEYSNAVQNSQFSDMFASYTEMGTELKATLGVSLASVLEALEPIALGLATTLQFVADAFNQFFAAINGESTYMKVNTAYVEEYSKSLKEAKRQVMGFDELNKLSGNEIDYSKLYVKTELTDGMVALGAAITAALGAMAAEEVIGFVTKLGNAKTAVEDLTGVVKDKNTALGDESDALDLDITKAAELVFGLVGAGGLLFGVKKLIDYLKEHPIEIGDKASEALAYIRISFEFTKELLKNTVLTVVIGVTNFFARAKELLAETAVEIAAKTFTVVIGITNFLSTVKSRLSETATAVAEKVFVVTIGITNFLSTVKSRLSETATAIAEKVFVVTIGITNFLSTVKSRLSETATEIAEKSFVVVIGITNFLTTVKTRLVETAAAVAEKTFVVAIGITNFLETAKSRLSELGSAIAEKTFVVAIGITNFLQIAKTRLAELGTAISEKSFEVEVGVSDFVTRVDEMLESAAKAVSDTSIELAIEVCDFVSTVKDKISSAATDVSGASIELAVGVYDFVSDVKSSLSEAVTAVAETSITVGIGISDFVSEAGKKLDELSADVGEVALTVAIGVSDFVTAAANGLADVGKKVAAESFTVAVKVYDFVSDLKEKLKQAAAAIKGFFVNLFSKGEATGDADSSGNFKEARMDDVNGGSAQTQSAFSSWFAKIKYYVLSSIVNGIVGNSSGASIKGNETLQEFLKQLVAGVAAGLIASFGSAIGAPMFASGGYPSTGSMFIAGEAGPELVGSINGRTGVASGEEVTGIKTAVYAIGEAIVDAINNKDMNASIQLDDGTIYKANQRGAKRVGNSLISFSN